MDPNHLPPGHPDRPNPYRLPDPSEGNMFDAIEKQSAEHRISPLSWPEHADSTVQKDLSERFGNAQQTYVEFVAFAKSVDENVHLSPEGRLVEKQKWARAMLSSLQQKLEKLTDEEVPSLSKSLDSHIAEFMGKHAAAPTEPHDIQVASEIRAMLRALPEISRMPKILDLARQGDRTVIQAVLNAPSYLSGVDPEMLRSYQIELTRKALPNRMTPWEGRKDALLMTRRALDGVIRYIGGETKLLPELRAHLVADPLADVAA